MHDWYLPQWIEALDTKQAVLVERTGFSKSDVSKLVNGGRRYNRDILNEIAFALHIEPYELLMHPDDAMRIRRLRETAMEIAADNKQNFTPAPAEDAPLNPRRKAS